MLRYGEFSDEWVAPLRFIGVIYDIQYNGQYLLAVVFWKWYIGLTLGKRSK